ncbi:TadE/TadG family type IV pilus assembly protein [Novosphingobium sp. MMS21-SN21R]|uniref:TadE/TadG family type IV pilus assembly protein n=1 Tax=Novosphingobium sp. MMS21-SN21R TaxID=2969298 RepID=UPI002883B9CF|nr:TadE/TadG family type IV pilus assembly protein [Novosphingobium sp. MMS21-SN21R]MDT0508104.1 TadE/TadG family type IV pilus assembly protein [Novosphingobium sp. MMS21-SN21R]
MMRSLLRDRSGSVVVEFALIGPTFIALMLGVLQIGMGMQNYNALRSVGSDVMRYAVVNYQTNNDVTNIQVRDYARSIASRAPYGLNSTRLAITVAPVATSRVSGTIEKTLTLTYSVPTVLTIIGFGEFPITYSQSIFLVND